MMKFEDEGGEVFEGRTATEVVRNMSRAKLTKSKSRASYRRSVARRIKEMMGKEVQTTSDKTFLQSLVEAGILTEVE